MPTLSDLMKREIIIDHYSSPRHKIDNSNNNLYQKIHMNSVSCIDDIYLYILLDNEIVKDATFFGIACAISTASTDILCDLIIGKTKMQANYILEQYLNMIFEKKYDESVLDEAIVFSNTSKQAARIKCATLGCNGFKELIK